MIIMVEYQLLSNYHHSSIHTMNVCILKLKQLLGKTTKLRVQSNLDTRVKKSIRKMSSYGHMGVSKQVVQGMNSHATRNDIIIEIKYFLSTVSISYNISFSQ